MTTKPETQEQITAVVKSEFEIPEEERSRLKRQIQRHFNREKVASKTDVDGVRKSEISTDNLKLVYTYLQAFGTLDDAVITAQLNYLSNVVRLGEADDKRTNTLMGMLYALEPRNPMEGMLAAQIVATNHVAMRMLAQSLEGQPLDAANHYTNRAHKAQSLLLRQMELLNTFRNGGQTTQKVVVERVEVKDGGQAIVGAVTAGGGGVKGKTED